MGNKNGQDGLYSLSAYTSLIRDRWREEIAHAYCTTETTAIFRIAPPLIIMMALAFAVSTGFSTIILQRSLEWALFEQMDTALQSISIQLDGILDESQRRPHICPKRVSQLAGLPGCGPSRRPQD